MPSDFNEFQSISINSKQFLSKSVNLKQFQYQFTTMSINSMAISINPNYFNQCQSISIYFNQFTTINFNQYHAMSIKFQLIQKISCKYYRLCGPPKHQWGICKIFASQKIRSRAARNPKTEGLRITHGFLIRLLL